MKHRKPLAGHEKTVQRLNTAMANRRVAHAYIFSGPEHCGKFALARCFSGALSDGRDSFEAFEGVFSGESYIMEPELVEKKGIVKQRSIDIEQVRDAQKAMAISALPNAYRTCVINDAHMLTLQAQNALLKMLEEPPKNSVIILVTHRTGSLLSTLISRCQTIAFSIPSLKEMKTAFQEIMESSLDFEAVWTLSLGRPGIFLQMVRDKTYCAKRQKWHEDIAAMASKNFRSRITFGESLSKNVSDAEEFLLLWEYLIRESVLNARDAKALLAAYRHIERIAATADILKTTNANARLMLENLMVAQ